MEPSRAEQDAASFETYVAMRGTALTRLAYLMVRDHHLAEDLAQEGLARLHRKWPEVSDHGEPDAYVRKVMLNQFLSWRRRRSWSERATDSLPDVSTSGDLTHEGVERDAMWDLLGELPPQQRAVIVLRFYEDLDDDTIAALLRCSPATVRSHASKALARLRSVVAEPNYTGGVTP